MKSILYLIVFVATATLARTEYGQETFIVDGYPPLIYTMHRPRRDITYAKYDRNLGSGTVTGVLGQNDYGLYGKGVYERNIFDNSKGTLDGHVTGTRVLGPFGDTSEVGGGLKWQTNNGATSLDLTKEIGGATRLDVGYGGKWRLDPRTDFSLKAGYSQRFPGSGPEVGIYGKITFP